MAVLGGALTDPTVVFTVGVVLVPLVFVEDGAAAMRYLGTPMMLASLALLALVVGVTHYGGKTVQVGATERRIAFWFLMNGVYFNLFLDVVSGQFQLMDEMSRQYYKVEPRYALGLLSPAGAPVFMTSMLELFFQAPFGILTYFAIHRGLPYRHLAAFFVSVLHATGVWYFYIPEALSGFPHLGGWPQSPEEGLSFDRLLFFWFGFWFCGILWIVIPFLIARRSWREIAVAVSEYERSARRKHKQI